MVSMDLSGVGDTNKFGIQTIIMPCRNQLAGWFNAVFNDDMNWPRFGLANINIKASINATPIMARPVKINGTLAPIQIAANVVRVLL